MDSTPDLADARIATSCTTQRVRNARVRRVSLRYRRKVS